MEFIESPYCWPTRSGYMARYIIVHGTAGGDSADAIANYFATPGHPENEQASAHYVIGPDGTVIQCVAESMAAWSNGGVTGIPAYLTFRTVGDGRHRDYWWNPDVNPNLLTISIEHVKASTDNSDELTVQQINASFMLINEICERWDIPRRFADANGGITGHYSMDPVNRSHCPGPYPWEALFEYLQGDFTVGIPQGWSDKNGILIAPNGFQVVQGFRNYILNNPWEAWNWPVESEHGQTPLELSNTSLGGGTQQLFRAYPLGWTPSRGVFPEWTGPEILALRAKIADLEAQIAKLTTPPTPPTAPAQQMPKAS